MVPIDKRGTARLVEGLASPSVETAAETAAAIHDSMSDNDRGQFSEFLE